MYRIDDLCAEAQEAVDRIWFIQAMGLVERTDSTVSIRLSIQPDLFVQVFLGELTGSLYFALIGRGQRIFGADLDSEGWHLHPYDAPHQHIPFPKGLEPKPLLSFLSLVEDLLIQYDLL
ncbi:MAG: hypothetical protein C4530_19815 [Desulfobacteraceae bacterium]|nr:MAG: hypothetical protein C4530_19815 [Desulfobacteraceae bacterium]